jgi:hypothetical protein
MGLKWRQQILNEKCFLLAATGLFVVFTLFTAPLFSMIAFTRGFIQVANDDSYYLLQQASAQEPTPEPETTDQESEPEEGGLVAGGITTTTTPMQQEQNNTIANTTTAAEEEQPCQVLSPVPPTGEVVTTSPELPICRAGTPPPPEINPCPKGQIYDEIKGCLCPDGSPPHSSLNGCLTPPPSDECAGIDKAIAEEKDVIKYNQEQLKDPMKELERDTLKELLKTEDPLEQAEKELEGAPSFQSEKVASLEAFIAAPQEIIASLELQKISEGCKSK